MIIEVDSSRRARAALLSVLLICLGARPCLAQTDPADPWEKFNRKVFRLNEGLDRHVIRPAARGFAGAPSPLQTGLRNFSVNLGEPLVFVNDVLQAHPGQAATTLGRFAINTIFGVLGFVDVAAKGRIPHHDNGFGTTLGRWGVEPGPYVMLPVLGPSTVRDTIGSGVDIALNPFTYVRYTGKTEVGVVTVVTDGLSRRAQVDQDLETIRQTSTDPYATLRSYYLQNRQAEVTGKTLDIQSLPDFDAPPAGPAAPTGAPGDEQLAPAPVLPGHPAAPQQSPTPPQETAPSPH